jgi:hypothetical protein
MMAKIRTEMKAMRHKRMQANMKDVWEATTACQEVTEANTEKTETDRGMMQSVAEHQVAP